MFNEIQKVRDDIRAVLRGTGRQKLPPYKVSWYLYRLVSYEFIVVLLYRVMAQLFRSPVLRPLALLMYFLHKLILKVDIHPAAKIGSGFQLVHGFSVVIGAQSQIGDDVAIFDSVSIGKKQVGELGKMPIVGNGVTIGSGAKLLGDIYIADGCMIGTNAVVISSFSGENSVIAGVPAHVISA